MKNSRIDEEQLQNIIKELAEALVIVEGKNDEKALKSLGLKDIIAIKGTPLYKVAEVALRTKKEVVILTDFDKKGREMEKKLRTLLQRHGKIPNSKLRCKVMSLEKNRIEDLWGIDTHGTISFREDDFYVKTSTDFDKIRGKSRDRCPRGNRKT